MRSATPSCVRGHHLLPYAATPSSCACRLHSYVCPLLRCQRTYPRCQNQRTFPAAASSSCRFSASYVCPFPAVLARRNSASSPRLRQPHRNRQVETITTRYLLMLFLFVLVRFVRRILNTRRGRERQRLHRHSRRRGRDPQDTRHHVSRGAVQPHTNGCADNHVPEQAPADRTRKRQSHKQAKFWGVSDWRRSLELVQPAECSRLTTRAWPRRSDAVCSPPPERPFPSGL